MIAKMSIPWVTAINREGSNDEEKSYLSNLTGMNPDQWKAIKSGGMALNTIIEQLKKIINEIRVEYAQREF